MEHPPKSMVKVGKTLTLIHFERAVNVVTPSDVRNEDLEIEIIYTIHCENMKRKFEQLKTSPSKKKI